MQNVRILFVGENWHGSCPRACAAALRRLGCHVTSVDRESFFPQVHRFSSRLVRRVARTRLVREFNDHILETARLTDPDILLVFKGAEVEPATVRSLRQRGIRTYNYFPDTSPFNHGPLLPQALPEYDCVFSTKKFWDKTTLQIPLCELVHIPHGYDPDVHRPLTPDDRDLQMYGHDVIFIGICTPHKAEVLAKTVELLPDLDLRIWGADWENCPEVLKPCVAGPAVFGDSYAIALQSARIALSIMSGRVNGVAEGDQTTTRSFEIPACGGFMLHERTSEVLGLYEEGTEIACFELPQELAQKIIYYLAHPEERRAVADAGHRRCVPAYSYDQRMAKLLRWHCERFGGVAAPNIL
jgi:spore maturation protein CgeB